MSQGKRGRGDHSPSLFPFLAVLLCTVGALVLMLVLVVGQSQASVKEAVEARADRAEELQAQVESIRDSFRESREKIQLEIEKKRMSLQSLEQQTSALAEELQRLQKTSELIEQQMGADESVEKIDAALTDLQKQLQEAAERLQKKLEKPTGEKPVFAIIPYEGSSGTHRRPIYLECRPEGIVIQPEGVLIALKDLRPPYGPGNPLDAALRSVRSYYAPGGAALNSSAYPLLVVRSSGIRTYALARMAMAGWDDQFGYELVEDDMELAYPAGEPRLAKELERTLATARSRQAALVMAMPGRYRQAIEELSDDKITFDDGGPADAPGFGPGMSSLPGIGGSDVSGGMLAAGQSPELGGVGQSNGFGYDAVDLPGGTSGDARRDGSTSGSGQLSGQRGGFAFAPDGSGRAQGGGEMNGTPPPGQANSNLLGFAAGGNTQNVQAGSGTSGQGTNSSWNTTGGSSTSGSQGTTSFAQGALNGGQYTRGPTSDGNSSSAWSSGEGGGQQSSRDSSSANGSDATSPGSAGNFRDAMQAARSRQSEPGGANASAATSADTGAGGNKMISANSEGFGSLDQSAGASGADSFNPSLEMTPSSQKKKQNAESVAKRRGRNWAWTAGPAKDTAVVRNIRIQCYEDRWIVLPDAGGKDKPQTVMLDVALQTSAEELAKIVSARTERWGYALAGGYWKPVLQVEVAPRGEDRYQQLIRLLEGSGLEIELSKPPTSVPSPAK